MSLIYNLLEYMIRYKNNRTMLPQFEKKVINFFTSMQRDKNKKDLS